jgi:hypothetical protein
LLPIQGYNAILLSGKYGGKQPYVTQYNTQAAKLKLVSEKKKHTHVQVSETE